MTEPLPALAESSLQIAWDFLDGVGELADPKPLSFFSGIFNHRCSRASAGRLCFQTVQSTAIGSGKSQFSFHERRALICAHAVPRHWRHRNKNRAARIKRRGIASR
jgi:hypothetical protein